MSVNAKEWGGQLWQKWICGYIAETMVRKCGKNTSNTKKNFFLYFPQEKQYRENVNGENYKKILQTKNMIHKNKIFRNN